MNKARMLIHILRIPTLGLIGCLIMAGGCNDKTDGTPAGGGGGGGGARVDLTILNTSTNPQPLPNVQVLTGGSTTPAGTTGPDGRTAVTVPTAQPTQLILQFPDGSQTIYPLTVPAGQQTAAATLFANPIAATTTTPGVTVTPTLAAPAGTADILEPSNSATITCAPPPAVCRFEVRGSASPVLGQPGTQFRIFVSVTPVQPSGGGTFPQFPPASVDPSTGAWRVQAQIGSETFQAQPGDTFQLVAIVTNAALTQGTTATPLRFDRPLDIPGVVHISPFVSLRVGARTETAVARTAGQDVAVLVDPPDSECERVPVIFRWRIDNRRPEGTYCSDLRLGPAQEPLDGRFAEVWHAGQATALQVPFDPRVDDAAPLQWDVRVTACDTPGALCADRDPPCQGRVLPSDMRQLRLSSQAPTCP